MSKFGRAVNNEKIIRKYEALALRRKGYSYRIIAQQLNISVATAHNDIKSCLDEAIKKGEKDVEMYRQLELLRLDNMLEKIQKKINKGELLAIDRGLKIVAQRAKLLGLDAIVKTENTENITFIIPNIEKKDKKDKK